MIFNACIVLTEISENTRRSDSTDVDRYTNQASTDDEVEDYNCGYCHSGAHPKPSARLGPARTVGSARANGLSGRDDPAACGSACARRLCHAGGSGSIHSRRGSSTGRGRLTADRHLRREQRGHQDERAQDAEHGFADFANRSDLAIRPPDPALENIGRA